jgi:hypothetical protein
MSLDLKTLVDNAGTISTSIAIITPILVHLRSVHKTLSKIAEVPDRMTLIDERLAKVESGMSRIEGEVVTNGGSSLKDAVLRIENFQLASFEFHQKPIIVLDKKGHLKTANKPVLDILQCEMEDLIGIGWLSYLQSSDEWERMVEAGNAMKSHSTVDMRPIEWMFRPVKVNGKCDGWMGSVSTK